MQQTSGLTVRQHQRQGIDMPIELTVSDTHATQVRFSSASAASSGTTIQGRAVDLSSGGMGLLCRCFVPRMCEGTLRVLGPDPSGAMIDGQPVLVPVFEQHIKVRRVYLHGREPTYALGVAFLDADASLDDQITLLLKRCEAGNTLLKSRAEGGPDE